MKAALELGRWVFLAPIGYLNAPRSIGKSLIHDPQRGSLVRRAFEDYATGRFTKEQLLKQVRTWGLTNRRGRPLTSQAIGVLLRNQLYAGIVDVPEYGVRGKRGDFEPLTPRNCFTRRKRCCWDDCRVPRPDNEPIPTSRCARSSAASRADAVSRAAGRRDATSTTRPTTAALAAEP
jgi:hypothetical protein